MHIQELARTLGGEVDPAADVEIEGVAPIELAAARHVTFLSNPRYAKGLATSGASAVFVEPDFADEIAPIPIRVANPYLAFSRAIDLFYAPPAGPRGVHPTAVLGEDVSLGADVGIGAYAVIGNQVSIGDGTVIHPHVAVYDGACIGPGCVLHSHSVVREHVALGRGVILQNGAVVGGDGFGFAPRGDGTYEKMTQAGTVELADDVEVQANAAVDRATVGVTRVGRGTKIDNLAQIGHGCDVGEDNIICGQVGLAGSTRMGNRITLAGQVGLAGHLEIADGVIVAAQAGVANSLTKRGVYGGSPAMPMRTWRRAVPLYERLPEIHDRLKAVERRLDR